MGARGSLSSRLLRVAAALAAGACDLGTGDSPTKHETTAPPLEASAADAAACAAGDPNQQRYGTPCLCCHWDEFSVAGSVDRAAQIERIVVTDARGEVRNMTPNSFGNFFRHFTLTPPLRAVVYDKSGRASTMRDGAPHGDCNACHGTGGTTRQIHGP